MLVEELISPVVPTLMATDTGSHALWMMEEAHLTQLPMIKEDKYFALVKEQSVLDWHTPEHLLGSADFLQYRPAVLSTVHPYEAARVAHEQNLTIVPVINGADEYLGSVTRDTLLKYITENNGLDAPGGIITLQMEPHSYSLAAIASICENESVVLISTQMRLNDVTGMIEVTLKTDRTILEPVLDSFERHGYDIKEVFGATDRQMDLRERYDLLMNYINM